MTISFKQMRHFSIQATDTSVGGIKDMLFDDENFIIRYIVADTNTWLPLSRKVVISPVSITHIDSKEHRIAVDMTSQMLKDSPSIDEHKPVSREYEEALFKYYGYGYYWVGPGAWGDFAHPGELVDPPRYNSAELGQDSHPVNHLRACGEVNGYEVATTNGNVGHICDFVFDLKTWTLTLVILDTHNWLPGGKKVAILPSHITKIDWAAHSVDIILSEDGLLNQPEVDLEKLDDTEYVANIVASA
ncbi:PRC-barrel domain-containing protein [Alteromonas sp. A079]|uniref:PRC-barrel domain-containing protein n=1 Tax=Alteromonas sp. A079 TaxID=3410268 RepID=UPI003B9EB4A8